MSEERFGEQQRDAHLDLAAQFISQQYDKCLKQVREPQLGAWTQRGDLMALLILTAQPDRPRGGESPAVVLQYGRDGAYQNLLTSSFKSTPVWFFTVPSGCGWMCFPRSTDNVFKWSSLSWKNTTRLLTLIMVTSILLSCFKRLLCMLASQHQPMVETNGGSLSFFLHDSVVLDLLGYK